MKDLAKEIDGVEVPPKAVGLWWLGQAGFAFKVASGSRIYLDPYLSDGVERSFGFKRLSLAPIDAWDVRAEWVVSSHEHLDHLDEDSLATIARRNPSCRFAGTPSCEEGYGRCGIAAPRRLVIRAGEEHDLVKGVRVRTFPADHGDLSPDALSLLLDFGGVRIYFTGDTALRLDRLGPIADARPDVALPCINGVFGNMDGLEAARCVAAIRPRLAIPCHFWMFKEHGGDPESFMRACAGECPGVEARLLGPGEGIVVTREEVRKVSGYGPNESK
jgi:L-ascorbate 6-phosphate lactonase